jgi:hypothetical protein
MDNLNSLYNSAVDSTITFFFKNIESFKAAVNTLKINTTRNGLDEYDFHTSPDPSYGWVANTGKHSYAYIEFKSSEIKNLRAISKALSKFMEFSYKSTAHAMYTHRRNGAFRASKQFLSWSETEVIILNEEEIKVLEKLLRDDKQLRHCTWNSEDFIYYIQAQDLQSGLKYGFGEYENEPTILGSIARFNRVENTIKLGYEINNCLSKDGWMVYNKLDGSYEYIFAEESAI